MAANGTTAPRRTASEYSELQASRLGFSLPLPEVLRNSFQVVDGPPSSAAGNPGLRPNLLPVKCGSVVDPRDVHGLQSARSMHFVTAVRSSLHLISGGEPLWTTISSACTGVTSADVSNQSLKIGVVLSGGQAPGGHNVISGLFDYLQERTKGSTLYGFKGGPAGIMNCKYVELTTDFVYPYRNQFKQAEETAKKLDLDGLVVIGGDDSNTNACLLAENFRGKSMKTKVIGCPKTIDGDLKSKEVPISFGFDTACKIYAEMIGNVMIDARSTGKYYHFVRLMGRAASHITLECSLQTHPNITIIGEEVQQLIAELNEILAHDVVDEGGVWKKKLGDQSRQLFELLPQAIQEQLLLERDPHGNVQVAKIETEKMLIEMVEAELGSRQKQGLYKNVFKGQSHFFGYEGRCGLPSNFDSNYCYALGYAAGALLQSGKTGLISSVGNLSNPVEKWTVGGTPLTSLMDVERRHGKFKPVIKKAMVELQGAPFKKFASVREEWALKNQYFSPGPLQYVGPTSNVTNHTLVLELGAQA
ncbi:hypothetical protein DH2020_039009 [Rehmannia glutinosa]|uniref:Phosphofructokinase domain-containing protein n=1 Tax=Rehmannia glutinosa TaxID=99300 RepID=A0ABR0UY55_REHGL